MTLEDTAENVLGHTSSNSQPSTEHPDVSKEKDDKPAETLTLEERKLYFQESVLSKLSLEKYIALWKMGNPYFVSHVSKHGFLDHRENTSREESPFSTMFQKLLSEPEHRLQPTFSILGLRSLSKDDVTAFLSTIGALGASSLKEAQEIAHSYLTDTQTIVSRYPDKSAVHCAVQDVLHEKYGAEINNECFVIFPADFIATQTRFFFANKISDFTAAIDNNHKKWNDLYIWPHNNSGISLDAGILFLPAQTMVDPATGSRYSSHEELDSNGHTIRVRDRYPDAIERTISWFLNRRNNVMEQIEQGTWIKSNDDVRKVFDYIFNNPDNNFAQYFFGTTEEKKLPYNYEFAYILMRTCYESDDKLFNDTEIQKTFEDALEIYLSNSNNLYTESEKQVSSKDYWEKYFSDNPTSRPAHIIYYTGNPHEAVTNFMQQNITTPKVENTTSSPLLDCEENLVTDPDKDSDIWKDYEALQTMISSIIEEHYS